MGEGVLDDRSGLANLGWSGWDFYGRVSWKESDDRVLLLWLLWRGALPKSKHMAWVSDLGALGFDLFSWCWWSGNEEIIPMLSGFSPS